MGLTLLLIVTDIFGGIKIIVACFAYINIHKYIYMYIYIYTHTLHYIHIIHIWAFSVAQLVKNLPTMQETWVRFLGWEDALEKEMATPSSILAWRTPFTEEPGSSTVHGVARVGHD